MIPTVQESAAPQRPAQAQEKGLAKLQEIAKSFESVFLQMIMKSMRSTVKKSGFLGGGQAESMFTGLFDSEVADRGGRHGKGLGIADMILKRYSKYVAPDAQPPKVDVKG